MPELKRQSHGSRARKAKAMMQQHRQQNAASNYYRPSSDKNTPAETIPSDPTSDHD